MTVEDRTYTQYFHDVSRTRMPANAQEERALFERYLDNGDLDARRRLVEGGLRFVIKTAKQYYRGDADFLKALIAAGNIGLITAVERYRPWVIRCPRCHRQNYVPTAKYQRCAGCNRALNHRQAELYTTRFLTYAAWWIAEAIRSELYSTSLVRIPPYKQKEHYRLRLAGKEVGFNYVPLEDTSVQASLDPVEIEQHVARSHLRKLLFSQLDKLRARYAYVIVAYYGLREEPKTLREIATKLGVCPERVRQIKVVAMTELRQHLRRCQVTQADDAYIN